MYEPSSLSKTLLEIEIDITKKWEALTCQIKTFNASVEAYLKDLEAGKNVENIFKTSNIIKRNEDHVNLTRMF